MPRAVTKRRGLSKCIIIKQTSQDNTKALLSDIPYSEKRHKEKRINYKYLIRKGRGNKSEKEKKKS